MNQLLRIHTGDNVAVCLTQMGDAPAGHKIALRPILKGEDVIKYGHRIGRATRDILKGDWVHTHNLATALVPHMQYTYAPVKCDLSPAKPRTFEGFVRKDGRVGIRNDIWILPTVGCVAKIAQSLATAAKRRARGSVQNVLALCHPYGCSQMGDDQLNTQRVLAALAQHPNAGGVLLLGLGCENSGVDSIKAQMDSIDESRVKFLVCQDVDDEMEQGLRLLNELIDAASGDARRTVGADALVAGLKCGGSDGFSGLTANPVIGGFSDKLISMGGSSILTEVPEMFGAEDMLMNRCVDERAFRDTVALIERFKQYFIDAHQSVYENPSPGNRQGGITTLEDKSLGCTQKSGSAQVQGVLHYAQRITGRGLHLLAAPGNDLVASTALAASGAQIVLFSTGRGTPFACPVPTMKIASNSFLAQNKANWIDFDAGDVVAHGASIEQKAEQLMDEVLRIASGKPVRSERAGLQDLAIFKTGVTL